MSLGGQRSVVLKEQDVTFKKKKSLPPVTMINDKKIWRVILTKHLTHPVDTKNLLLASPKFFGPLLEPRVMRNPCFTNLTGIDHDIHDPNHFCWNTVPHPQYYREKVEMISFKMSDGSIAPEESSFLLGFGCLTFQKPDNDFYWIPMLNDFRYILATCGSRIHHFCFKLRSDDKSEWNSNYLLVQEFLLAMPNLVTLELCGFSGKSGISGCNSVLRTYPLPSLEKLVVLKVANFPAVLVNAFLLKYGPKLKKLAVSIMPGDREGFLYGNKSMALRALATHLTDVSLPLMTSADDVNRFLGSVNWPSTLKSLSVSIQLEPDGQALIFKKLSTKIVEKFGKHQITALNLRIQSQGLNTTESLRAKKTTFIPSDIRLQLPFLKRLWIHVSCVSFTSIDFILGLRDSLEELVVNHHWAAPDWSEANIAVKSLINFVKCQNRMQNSNIWIMMPKLRKVAIRRTNDYNDNKFPTECFTYSCRPLLTCQDEFIISLWYYVLDEGEEFASEAEVDFRTDKGKGQTVHFFRTTRDWMDKLK